MYRIPTARAAHVAEVDASWHDRDAEGLLAERPHGRRCACCTTLAVAASLTRLAAATLTGELRAARASVIRRSERRMDALAAEAQR